MDRAGAPTIDGVDRLPPDACAAALAPLFEGAPRLLARLTAARPFGTPERLFAVARRIAREMPEDEQLELIDAHPRPGAAPASVSALSFREQGYDRETASPAATGDTAATADTAAAPATTDTAVAKVAATLDALNRTYEQRFGFRYCVWVAGRPRSELISGFRAALDADRAAEIIRALDAVVDIAADRHARLRPEG